MTFCQKILTWWSLIQVKSEKIKDKKQFSFCILVKSPERFTNSPETACLLIINSVTVVSLNTALHRVPDHC